MKKSLLKPRQSLLEEGRRVVMVEAESLKNLARRLGPDFVRAARLLHGCRGKVAVAGVGKSGLIAQKFASTLASFGRSALFIHPTEAVHGDLGALGANDLLVALSQSGNTQELVNFAIVAKKRFGLRVISLVGTPGGEMDRLSDIVLATHVTDEACAMGLAPTASSTAALALTDALAVAVSRLRRVQATDYASLHPAGSLGQRLYAPVEKLMRRAVPMVDASLTLKEVAPRITRGGVGFVVVRDKGRRRWGIITDGDMRRAAQKGPGAFSRKAGEAMSSPPKSIGPDALGMDALVAMERARITSLLVMTKAQALVGVLHLHDVLRFGLNLPSGLARRI